MHPWGRSQQIWQRTTESSCAVVASRRSERRCARRGMTMRCSIGSVPAELSVRKLPRGA